MPLELKLVYHVLVILLLEFLILYHYLNSMSYQNSDVTVQTLCGVLSGQRLSWISAGIQYIYHCYKLLELTAVLLTCCVHRDVWLS